MFRPFLLGLLIVFSSTFIHSFYKFLNFDGRPTLIDDFCWGRDENCKNDTKIYPFKINIKKEEIEDLIKRLDNAREFSPSMENTQNRYGLNGQVINDIIKYVKTEYNLTKRQIFLNKYPQYTTYIQGVNIHFLHVKNKNENNLPLIPVLMLHGWPSSVREFYESVPIFMSEDNRYVFDLVIPSLVGFGYSEGNAKPKFRIPHMANMMRLLMERLGYRKYVVHGSDWGAIIATDLATLFPKHVLGFHSNFCISLRTKTFLKMLVGALYPPAVIDAKFQHKLYPLFGHLQFLFFESGYFHLMATKPDTIGHILDNTPVGLITFLFEKMSVGRNRNFIYSESAGLETFDKDGMLDIILFYYWFPKKAVTASRIYGENGNLEGILEGPHNVPVDPSVPCYCTFFEDEFLYMPENFLRDKYPNLIRYENYPGIGHYPAIQANEIFTRDILTFIEMIFENNSTGFRSNLECIQKESCRK